MFERLDSNEHWLAESENGPMDCDLKRGIMLF